LHQAATPFSNTDRYLPARPESRFNFPQKENKKVVEGNKTHKTCDLLDLQVVQESRLNAVKLHQSRKNDSPDIQIQSHSLFQMSVVQKSEEQSD
jgi:hypothetical protein